MSRNYQRIDRHPLGVHCDDRLPQAKRWVARVQIDGRRKQLGTFPTSEQAAIAVKVHRLAYQFEQMFPRACSASTPVLVTGHTATDVMATKNNQLRPDSKKDPGEEA